MTQPAVALVTGITGQDGSYLAEQLLDQGYHVHGVIRRASVFNTDRIEHLYQDPHEQDVRLHLHYGDLADGTVLRRIIETARPDVVYNLAAQSHVGVSFKTPEYTAEVTGLGVLRLLEALRDHSHRTGRKVRFYQASSSEMYGSAPAPQGPETPFHPRSPYACAKVYAYHQVINYREAYGLFACNGILFNHESPRRGETFVTRKITRAVGRIKLGLQKKLYLGNLDARRDWGHARDYVEAMVLIMQGDEPGDFVVASGESHSVREFAASAFAEVGLDYQDFVEVDPRYFRPSEVEHLHGDATQMREKFGWRPRTSFAELVAEMVRSDLKLAERELVLQKAGHDIRTRGTSL